MATPYYETKDGFESQMAINYIGHFLLTHLLFPELIEGIKTNDGKNVRIVNVSSCAHLASDIDFDDFHCKYESFEFIDITNLSLIYDLRLISARNRFLGKFYAQYYKNVFILRNLVLAYHCMFGHQIENF